MSKVADGHLLLLLYDSEEWSPIIDEEVKDTMLIWQLESGGVDGGERGGEGWHEV